MELKTIIENGIDIFDFDFPLFDETYRETFKQKFINHFYFREIGSETVGRFKFYLKEQLNLIMPVFNKMYMSQGLEQRILDNYDVTETYTRTTTGNTTANNTNENLSLYSDTPKKRIDIDTNDFVTNINKDNTTIKNNITDNGTEQYTLTKTGNIGVQYDSQAVTAYENSLRNIDLEIFNQLEILFMGVF
jgi:hypothetical protein